MSRTFCLMSDFLRVANVIKNDRVQPRNILECSIICQQVLCLFRLRSGSMNCIGCFDVFETGSDLSRAEKNSPFQRDELKFAEEPIIPIEQ